MGPASTSKLQRAVYRVWLAVGVLALIYASYRVVARPLAVVLAPLLLAAIIVYLLNPIVSGCERRGLPRWAGTTLAYLVLAIAVALAALVLTPLLIDQVSNFAQAAPQYGTKAVSAINNTFETVGLDLRLGSGASGEEMAGQIQEFLAREENRLAALAVLGGMSGVATGLLHLLLVFVLGPVIAFYLLVDLPRVRAWSVQLIPPHVRTEAEGLFRRLGEVVGGYVRGQLLVALFVGVATSVGLALVGLPFWLVVGVIAGITNLIPLVGPFVAGFVGVSIALFTDGLGLAALVVVVVTLVQQTDNHAVSPLVMGRTVRVHPLAVLFALLVGGTLYGIFGLFVAVPAVAAANVVFTHVWQTRVPWAAAEPAPPGLASHGGQPDGDVAVAEPRPAPVSSGSSET